MARTANRPTRRLALERRRTEAAARQKAYDALTDDEKMAKVAARLGSTPEAIIQSVRDEPHHYNMPREIARIHTKRIVAAVKEAK
jgi:phosphoserine phosphatase